MPNGVASEIDRRSMSGRKSAAVGSRSVTRRAVSIGSSLCQFESTLPPGKSGAMFLVLSEWLGEPHIARTPSDSNSGANRMRSDNPLDIYYLGVANVVLI